ncbi:MAG: circadian clock KaiB family protein [Granulosicoccus sp.]
MQQLKLKLYIAGQSVRSDAAVINLKRLLQERVSVDYVLNVIDVIDEPAQAEEDSILATPTLIKSSPAPVRRIIGDLSDREALLVGLDLAQMQITEILKT